MNTNKRIETSEAIMRLDRRTLGSWERVFARNGTIWSLYNNGVNLYLEPDNLPVTTFYEQRWKHLPYFAYSLAQRVPSGNRAQYVILQTLGHDTTCNAGVMFGCNPEQILVVPPLHILHVVIQGEIKVTSSLCRFQPLPRVLVQLRAPHR